MAMEEKRSEHVIVITINLLIKIRYCEYVRMAVYGDNKDPTSSNNVQNPFPGFKSWYSSILLDCSIFKSIWF